MCHAYAGIAKLCAHPWSVLQRLDLSGCNIGAAGLAALAACPGVAGLVTLRCSNNTLSGQEAGQHLAQLLRAANKLHTLHMDHTALGDEGAAALAGALSSSCPELRQLSTAHAGITDAGG